MASETLEKKHISPSAINLYTKCGEAYRRRYIMREVIPPGVAIIKGTSVHRGAEFNFKQKVDSKQDLPFQDVVDFSVASFETVMMTEGLLLNKEEEAIGKTKVVGQAKDSTAKLAELYAKESAPLYQPKEVEMRARIELPNSTHDLLSIADMVTEEDAIVEYKTGKKWNQDRADHEPQLTFQAMTFRALKGRDPSQIVVENLVDSKTPVRNSVVTTRDASDYQIMINRINAVLDGINKGVYPPANPMGWWCSPSFCGYWSTCGYVKKR